MSIEITYPQLTADSLIPKIIAVLKEKECSGFELVQQIDEFTHPPYLWMQAFIYPVLKKLENKRILKSYWDKTDIKRPKKIYKLSKKYLKSENII